MRDKIKVRDSFEEAFKDFDFEKVYNIMNFLKWRWWTNANNSPTIDEMKNEVKRLFEGTLENDKYLSSGSGGFKVSISKSGNVVDIEFIPVHSSFENYE